MTPSPGDDQILGGAGHDTLVGDLGSDILRGGMTCSGRPTASRETTRHGEDGAMTSVLSTPVIRPSAATRSRSNPLHRRARMASLPRSTPRGRR
ncbi:MAG: hypothetical protein H0W94_01250 [Actinobacteria bacterium]|nr:hypothetical protein [Actinomycetota bacterium]